MHTTITFENSHVFTSRYPFSTSQMVNKKETCKRISEEFNRQPSKSLKFNRPTVKKTAQLYPSETLKVFRISIFFPFSLLTANSWRSLRISQLVNQSPDFHLYIHYMAKFNAFRFNWQFENIIIFNSNR